MIAYFVRLIVGGFARLWLALFIIFYLVIEIPLVPGDSGGLDCPHCHVPPPPEPNWLLENAHLDKPWPLNYVDWLFDPEDTTTPGYDLYGEPLLQHPKGVNISIGNLQIKGSGVLTGDLGISLIVDQGTPVIDVFGRGIDKMFAFLISLIAALMAITAAQRFGRPQPYRTSAPPTASALIDWRHLHAASPLDVAMIGRQWVG